jgi:hypothetical protein
MGYIEIPNPSKWEYVIADSLALGGPCGCADTATRFLFSLLIFGANAETQIPTAVDYTSVSSTSRSIITMITEARLAKLWNVETLGVLGPIFWSI